MTKEERQALKAKNKAARQEWLSKHPRINKLVNFFKDVWGYVKRPTFFIPFIITWTLLMSPFLYGSVMYIITAKPVYYNLALHWYALTAPALPIPVIPISSAVGIAVESLIYKIKTKNGGGNK